MEVAMLGTLKDKLFLSLCIWGFSVSGSRGIPQFHQNCKWSGVSSDQHQLPSSFIPLPISIISPVYWQPPDAKDAASCLAPPPLSQFFFFLYRDFLSMPFLQTQLKIKLMPRVASVCFQSSSFLAVCDCFHDAFMLCPHNIHSEPSPNWINKQFRYQSCCLLKRQLFEEKF